MDLRGKTSGLLAACVVAVTLGASSANAAIYSVYPKASSTFSVSGAGAVGSAGDIWNSIGPGTNNTATNAESITLKDSTGFTSTITFTTPVATLNNATPQVLKPMYSAAGAGPFGLSQIANSYVTNSTSSTDVYTFANLGANETCDLYVYSVASGTRDATAAFYNRGFEVWVNGSAKSALTTQNVPVTVPVTPTTGWFESVPSTNTAYTGLGYSSLMVGNYIKLAGVQADASGNLAVSFKSLTKIPMSSTSLASNWSSPSRQRWGW